MYVQVCVHVSEMTRLIVSPAFLTLTLSPWWTHYVNVVLSNILPLCGCHRGIVTVEDVRYAFLWPLQKCQIKLHKDNTSCPELHSLAFCPCTQTICLPLQVVKMEIKRDQGSIMFSTLTLHGANPLLSDSFTKCECFFYYWRGDSLWSKSNQATVAKTWSFLNFINHLWTL